MTVSGQVIILLLSSFQGSATSSSGGLNFMRVVSPFLGPSDQEELAASLKEILL